MKTYIIKKTSDISLANVDYVNTWRWGKDYTPVCPFRAVHTDDSLIISLRCYEKEPYAAVTKKNGYVCNDSCLEFFFSPSEDNSEGYFNFEVNANPTYLFGFNPVGGKEEYIEWDDSEYDLKSTTGKDENGDFWQIDFTLPYALIKKYVPEASLESGSIMRGNVYKCGKHGQIEHYGTWSPVETDGPNFHKPEFYGKFIIE